MTEVQEVLHQWQQGRSERKIARSLGLSRNTIRKILFQARSLGLKETDSEKSLEDIKEPLFKVRELCREKKALAQAYLAEHHGQIEAWRSLPHMTVTQMVRLFSEQKKQVSETSLRRYIQKHFSSSPPSTVHLETIPGQQGQVDFCYVGLMKDPLSGEMKKAHAFIITLSFSRYRFVRFVFRQDVKTWIDCHIRAFHFFGGIPSTILLDNLKSGVVLADIYDPTINRCYGELERHYGFVADPAKVRTPEHKGKVERSVQIVRQQILAGRVFEDIEKANTYALHWCRHEISQRVTRTTGSTPFELFNNQEKGFLKQLPSDDYECPTWQEGKVHRDHHVVFEGSFYSVPCAYRGKKVWIRATQRMVKIYYEEQQIKTHIRSQTKGQWVTDKQDYPESSRFFLEKDQEKCLTEAKTIGAETSHLLEEILSNNSLTNLRKAQAILRLCEKYGRHRLESACQRAVTFGNYKYKSLKRILEQNLDQKEDEEDKSSVCLSSSHTTAYLRPPHELVSRSQGEARL